MPEALFARSEDPTLLAGVENTLSIDFYWVRDRVGSPSVHLVVAGDLDCIGAPLLQDAWNTELADLPVDVFVDLSQVEFCNAAGLRVVAAIVASGPKSRRLRWSVQPPVARLLALLDIPVNGQTTMVVVPRGRRQPVMGALTA